MLGGFNQQNQLGKIAETAVKQILENRGNQVTDVSSQPDFQKIDVDFIINNKLYFEIKLDNRAKQTGNVFLEEGKDRKTGYYPSWFSKCQANVLVFYDSDTKIAQFYDWGKLKDIARGYPTKTYYDYVDNCITYFKAIPAEKTESALLLVQEAC